LEKLSLTGKERGSRGEKGVRKAESGRGKMDKKKGAQFGTGRFFLMFSHSFGMLFYF
jgi:hypothetical protein